MADAHERATPPDRAGILAHNLRLLPWWWVLRWTWFGDAINVIYLTQERGLTLGEVFLLEAVSRAVVIAAQVPTGIFADRYGRRLSLLLGSGAWVAALLLFGTGSGVALLLFSYTLFGVSIAFIEGTDSALLFDTLAPLGRTDEFASRTGRLNASFIASRAICMVGGALMVRWLPLWFPIILSAFASLPGVLIAWRMVEPPKHEARPSFLDTGRAAVLRVWHSRALWSAILLMALATTGIMTMGIALQPLVVGYGLPVWSLGPFVAAQLALASVGSLIATPVTRVLGLRGAMLLTSVAGALSLLAGAFGTLWLFPLFLLPSITFNVLYVQIIDFIARRSPEHQRATTISIGSAMSSALTVAGTIAAGVLTDGIGLNGALAVTALTLAGLSVATFLVWVRAGDTVSESALEPLPS